ncbi:MAG: sugar ABC transporter permease [Planctomycetota bacterium]|nr:sugar ABC transporter permease [Planctomycetota bacterium]
MASTRSNLIGGPGTLAVLLSPALVLFTLFLVWPALNALLVSMSSWTGFSPESKFTGLENYANLAGDARFWKSLKNTFYFVIVGGIGHFFFAFLFAVALHRPGFKGKKVFQTMIFFPSFVSAVGVAILWARLYDYNDGLLNRVLRIFSGQGVNWLASENAMDAIVIASIWAGVGGQMVLLLAGMKRIPSDILEAARIDGASEWQVFRHVTLPMMKDVTYVALSLWLIGSMQVFGLVQALAGPGVPVDMETVSTYQYAISFNARDNIYMMGRGTAMAVALVLCIVLMVGALRLAFGKRELEY